MVNNSTIQHAHQTRNLRDTLRWSTVEVSPQQTTTQRLSAFSLLSWRGEAKELTNVQKIPYAVHSDLSIGAIL